ncbi:hypothetical protein [Microlunatus soli]|uniref:hypothetical protein n=1 Tax=Microlunatus soli TaxID=630515 RepID=UPI0012FC8017|nr:hypothetical protein [Microlunatus soli]
MSTARPTVPHPGSTSSPLLAAPDLDAWMDRLRSRHQRQHPLHSDFHRANVLVQGAGPVPKDDQRQCRFSGDPGA